jgi:hypothetical protein
MNPNAPGHKGPDTAPDADAPATLDPEVLSGATASAISPELMQRAETALAAVIGPLAKVLVARYAKSAPSSRQFFESLGGHIRNLEERQAFFQMVRDDNR